VFGDGGGNPLLTVQGQQVVATETTMGDAQRGTAI